MTEWIAPTKRKPLTTKERTAVFMRHHGVCCLCSMKITPGQEWDVEHGNPLWAGGSDDREDLAPAHRRCHRGKTAIESTQRAKEARVRSKHIGSFETKGSLAGSRKSPWKRKMNGEVERRS